MSSNTCYIELHYLFSDSSHTMDALIHNKCEIDFLRILNSIAKTCRSNINIEIEPKIEGGLISRYKITGQTQNNRNKNSLNESIKAAFLTAIFLAPTTIAVNGINEVVKSIVTGKTKDVEKDSLEKEKLKLEIEKIRLDIDEKKAEKQERTLGNAMKEVEATEDFRYHLVKIIDKVQPNKWRYQFYKKLAKYEKANSISVQLFDSNNHKLTDESTVEREAFIAIGSDVTKELNKWDRYIDLFGPPSIKHYKENINKKGTRFLDKG